MRLDLSRGHAPGAQTASVSGWLLPALSLGVCLGSTWGALRFSGFGPAWSLPLTFIVVIAASLLLAATSATWRLSERGFAGLAAGLMVLHALCVCASGALAGASEALALGIASSLLEGAGLACVGRCCLLLLAGTPARDACAGVCAALLVANVWYLALIGAPQAALAAQWIAGGFLGVGLLFAALRGASASGPAEGVALVTDTPRDPTLLPARAPEPAGFDASLAAFLVTAGVLMLAQGLFSAAAGFGVDPAFSGSSSSILVVGVRLLMFLLCLTGLFSSFAFEGALAAFCALWIVLLAVSDLALFQGAAAWGVFLLALGQYVLMAFVLMAGVRGARGCGPARAASVACASFAVVMMNQPTRLIGLAVADALTPFDLHVACVVSVAVVACVSVVALALVVRSQRGVRPAVAIDGAGVAPEPTADAPDAAFSATVQMLWRRERELFGRFARFCKAHQLTEREQEVLFEALHGYTVAAIARRRGISQETVKTYLKRAYARAGCSNKQDLLAVMDAEAADERVDASAEGVSAGAPRA